MHVLLHYCTSTTRIVASPTTLRPPACNVRRFASVDEFLRGVGKKPVTRMLAVGTPYGALHEKLTGRPLAASMPFAIAEKDRAEVQPWLDLLGGGGATSTSTSTSTSAWTVGTFSQASLDAIPLSFMVHADWAELVQVSSSGSLDGSLSRLS